MTAEPLGGTLGLTMPNRSPHRLLFAGVSLFLALHVAASFAWPTWIWGAHHLQFLPRTAQLAWLFAAVLLVLPGVSLRIGDSVERLAGMIAARRWLLTTLLVGAVLLSWGSLRSRNHFLGDGYLIAGLVSGTGESGESAEGRAGYLTILVYRAVFHVLGNFAHVSALTTIALLNTLAGILFVWGAVQISRELVDDRMSRAVLASAVLASGGIQLFLGYVENYSLMHLALLLFVLHGIRCSRGTGRLWQPTLALAAAVALHLSAAVFVVAWLVLALRSLPASRRRLGLGISVVFLAMLGAALLWRLESVYHGLAVFLPVLGDGSHSYSVLGRSHWTLVVNLLLLGIGGGFLLPLLDLEKTTPARGSEAIGRFLAVCALSGGLYLLLIDPRLGSRDWDLLSLPVFPMLAWLGFKALSGRRAPDKAPAVIAIAAMALHTLPWIAVNTSVDRGARMLVAMTANDGAYRSRNSRANQLLGAVLSHAGQLAAAESVYQRATLVTGDPHSYFNLGTVLEKQGKHDEAVHWLERATAADNAYVDAWVNLATAYWNGDHTVAALSAVERAVSLDATHLEAQELRRHFYDVIGRSQAE